MLVINTTFKVFFAHPVANHIKDNVFMLTQTLLHQVLYPGPEMGRRYQHR